MKPIWYFVGWLLATMGAIIAVSGVYGLIVPPKEPKAFAQWHPDIWWGLFMLACGLVFVLINRRKVVR
jgi:hypothetical protein